MSKLTSLTIREDNIPTYNDLREYLKRNNTSMGDYLIRSYIKDIQQGNLDYKQK